MLGRWDALLGILNCASVCYDLLKTINFGEEREIGSKLLKNEVFIIPENNRDQVERLSLSFGPLSLNRW